MPKKVSKKEEKVGIVLTDYANRDLEIVDPDDLKKEKKETKSVKEINEEKRQERIARQRKEAKKSRLATYFIAFLLCLVFAGVTYWYKEVYNKDEGKYVGVVNKKLGYSFVPYNSDKSLNLLNDTYLLEYSENTLYGVVNKDGKILFEDEIQFDRIYMDLKNNLYVVTDDESELGNLLSLYKLEYGKFILVKDYSEIGYDFRLITIEKDNMAYLYGISKVAQRAEESDKVNSLTLIENEEVINLDKDIYFGNINEDTFTTLSERYLPVNNKHKVGLYDIKEEKLIIQFNYDNINLVDKHKEYVIAEKDNKKALMTFNTELLIRWKYDYMVYEDNYILVGKDNKLGVLDKNFKEVTDLIIDCEYKYSNVIVDTYKKGNNIIILINDTNKIEGYDTYVVREDGKVEHFEAEFFDRSNFSYVVSDDNKIYTIYDENLNKVGVIDLHNYDFENRVTVVKVGNTYILGGGIYFNEKLEKVDELQEYEVKGDNYNLKLTSDGKVKIMIGKKEVGSYTYKFPYELYNETDEGYFYYLDNNNYASIKKVN